MVEGGLMGLGGKGACGMDWVVGTGGGIWGSGVRDWVME